MICKSREKDMFSRRCNHIAVWCAMLGVGLYVLYEIATEFTEAGVHTGWALENAGMFPRILGVFILLVTISGICLICYDAQKRQLAEDDVEGDVAPFDTTCIYILIMLLGYVGILEVLGYYIASSIFMAVCLIILRNDNTLGKLIISSIFISIPIVVVFGWIFEYVLGFVLPLGVWALTLS